MADVSIVAAATANVPRDYLIPGAQEILPKSVSAQMDGSAAASAWFPCLQVLDPSGRVMFSAISSTAMAAGASADVSWFPRVSGAPGGASQTLIGARIQATSAQTITSGSNTDLHYQQVYFDTDGMANLASNDRILTVNTAGIYLVVAATVWDYHSPAAGRRINAVLQNGYYSGVGVPNQFSVVDERMPIWATENTLPPTPRTTNLASGLFLAAVGDFFSSGVFQGADTSVTCNGYEFAFLSAVLIGAT